MVDAILPELPINFEHFLPNEQHFGLSPSVVARLLAVLHDVEHTALKILEDHNQSIECAPAHDKVID